MLSNASSDLIRQLEERGAKRIALQFPEGLKRKAPEYTERLRKAGFEVIVSGDPCYGACDLALDTLLDTDVLVHVGHAPVDDRPNVIYLPYTIGFSMPVLDVALPLIEGKTTGLVTTVQHVHLVPEMETYLRSKGVDIRVADGRGRTPLRGQVLGCCFTAARNTQADLVLFVGTGLFHPVGIALTTRKRVIALDPLTGAAQEVSGDTLLRRRFAVIEKARGAKSVGIIVSTKSGQRRMDLARRLAGLSPTAVIVTMQEASPDELLNLGFGCYVNTACPRLAYDDQVRFPVPVLSPQEFEILCGARTWDEYEIDEIP
ncbi:MAG: diphthamide biosynthesis enzyme Dph2 [Methanoregula sp.]|jgi:2-(3-amino-3-carboxypropyl)histidine synthase|uniref:diphthamide biosynthesis enzyme Dph2 n=1 Tax=Methanoregula sp. TaxID=2052170 RepID=UPI0025CC6A25|nr:diphthamide biosynthesis enzyme Dph2 [Methanoregula sp.]MCK9630703.1 diphthamide biosynthesis enzyme Dph2 [Methanoregula sp.]